MNSRLLIAIISYLLSSVGIFFSLQMIIEELSKPKEINLIVFIWIAAWLIHIIMTLAWIQNKKLPRYWPALGLITGISSFLAMPFFSALHADVFGAEITLEIIKNFMLMQTLLVGPCILLAIYLVHFHMTPSLENR